MESQDHEKTVRHSFDSFCKRILKTRAIDIQREMKRRGEREVTFSELSAHELASLAVMDEYFTGAYIFCVLGESVGVTDADLAEALQALPQDRRDIILLSYFLDMTDREIADKLNMAQGNVAYRRASSLRKLKNLLESEE